MKPDLMLDILLETDADPGVVYAYSRTGMLLTPDQLPRLSIAEVKDWFEALEEYRRFCELRPS